MFTFFYPGKNFPSISVTGSNCELNCQHCSHHYLRGMKPAPSPEKLYSILTNLEKNGGKGALISGGSDRNGHVPVEQYLQVIAKIKNETDLILNVHTGFIGCEQAKELGEAGVDVVSVDVVGDSDTVRNVYKLNKGQEDYRSTLEALSGSGIPHVVPHITIGINYGELSGEIAAIDLIKDTIKPAAIVINSLIPTKGTPMEKVRGPENADVLSVIKNTVSRFKAPVFLGCMRQKGNPELELAGMKEGLSGIVLPSKEGEEEIMKLRKCRVVEACCATFPML